MTLAKSSLEIAEGYLELVPPSPDRERLFAAIVAEHERTVSAVLGIVEARELLDRHPVLQRSIRLRNPYVDPMNAIQVELLRRYRSGEKAATRPLLRFDRRHCRRSAEHRLTHRPGRTFYGVRFTQSMTAACEGSDASERKPGAFLWSEEEEPW